MLRLFATAIAVTFMSGCYLSTEPPITGDAGGEIVEPDAGPVAPRAVDAGRCGVRWVCRCVGEVCTRSDGRPCSPDDIRDPADYCP